MRILKLNSKLYRPNDELLQQRHYQEVEWERAKRHYLKEVLAEARDQRKMTAMLSRNPATMRRSCE